MYQRNPLLLIVMWMCIDISLVPMSSPASMSEANAVIMSASALHLHPLNAVAPESVTRCELSPNEPPILVYRYDPARVVPTRFKDLQTLDANLTC